MSPPNTPSIIPMAPRNDARKAVLSHRFSRQRIQFLACLVCMVFVSATVRAADYRLESFAVGSGGGTSQGGNYEVTGSTGQVDAGIDLIGGDYRLDGGFWPTTVEITIAGGPTLEISWLNGSVRMAWTPVEAGFVLQVASSADPGDWVDVPGGNANPTILPASESRRFFRLIRR